MDWDGMEWKNVHVLRLYVSSLHLHKTWSCRLCRATDIAMLTSQASLDSCNNQPVYDRMQGIAGLA